MGIENVLPGVVAGKEDDLVSIGVRGNVIQAISGCAIGDRVYALVEPQDITFNLHKEASSARNAFEGRISRMTPVGPLMRIEVDCGFPLLGVLTRRSAEELDLAIGKQVYASFKATAIHVIQRRG